MLQQPAAYADSLLRLLPRAQPQRWCAAVDSPRLQRQTAAVELADPAFLRSALPTLAQDSNRKPATSVSQHRRRSRETSAVRPTWLLSCLGLLPPGTLQHVFQVSKPSDQRQNTLESKSSVCRSWARHLHISQAAFDQTRLAPQSILPSNAPSQDSKMSQQEASTPCTTLDRPQIVTI